MSGRKSIDKLKKKVYSFTLSPKTILSLKKIAEKQNISLSRLVDQRLQDHINK